MTLALLLTGCVEAQPGPLQEVKESDLPTAFINSIGMKLVRIPSGKFTMGEEGLGKYRDDHRSSSIPLHEVELSCFYLGEKEVTKTQFREYVKAKGADWNQYPQVDPTAVLPHVDQGKVLDTRTLSKAQHYLLFFPADDYPITEISLNEAGNYCKWLSDKEGLVYRLPTEAEWEYACRAGTRTIYWWGDKCDPRMARIGGDYVEFRGHGSLFAPVGSYPPNPWGLYDMHGNVFEWVSDYFSWDYYGHSPHKNPKGPTFGQEHVIRGGGGNSDVDDPQTHSGARETAGVAGALCIGFRIVCEAPSVAKSLPKAETPASVPVKP